MRTLLFALLFGFSIPLFATDAHPKSVAELQAQYQLLVELHEKEAISDSLFNAKVAYFKQLATEEFQVDLNGVQLQQVVSVQRIDWIGSAFYLLSALLGFFLIIALISKYRKPLIKLGKAIIYFFVNSKFFQALAALVYKLIYNGWEVAAYTTLAVALYYYNNEYVVLLISFFTGSLVNYSVFSRVKEKNYRQAGTITSFLLTLLWGAIAYIGNNAFVGFMTTAALISALGFAMFMMPHMIAIGLKKDSAPFVLRLTAITLVLSIFSWILFYTNYIPALVPLKEHLRVFKVGMVSLIPLAYFIGLGYMAFFIYEKKEEKFKKILAELVAFGSGSATLVIALLYGIGSMFWIGLFFMTWFAIDKWYELVYKRFDSIVAGLIFAAVLGGIGYLIKSNLGQIIQLLETFDL